MRDALDRINYQAQHLFIRGILWQLRVDHLIGRGTGRDPAALNHTKQDIRKWEGELHRLEVRHAL